MIRIADTENGTVRGLPAADPRITSFKGIPFAAPPVGKNRWRAPQPCDSWEGVLDAYQFAPISVQDTPGVGTDVYCKEWHVDPEIPMSEDCLYLNIWTNATSKEDKLPVLVWFFGGALQWGYPAEMEFDGERIARRQVIVVTINYRINVFGFLAHPELTKDQPEAPTNFGHLDQQAGLRWVIRNIEAFGGDPQNITIAGQSAGGGSVLSQMTCPTNQGAFQKAVIMSGMFRSPYGDKMLGKPRSLTEAEEDGEKFIEFLGVTNMEEARKLDAFYVCSQYSQYRRTHEWVGSVVDHKFCFGDPVQLLMENKYIKVPIMMGNTSDEFLSSIFAEDEEQFKNKVDAVFKEEKDLFLSFPEATKKLDATHYAPVSAIECLMKTFLVKNSENKNKNHCYYYRFDADIPGYDNPGAFHSVDLWFFFETLAKCWRPFKGNHYDLSRLMCNYFTNFIKNGDPNGCDADGACMPTWKSYNKDIPCEMIFRTDDVHANDLKETPFMDYMIKHIRTMI